LRIARVRGVVTMSRRLPELKPGRYLLAETLDGPGLAAWIDSGVASGPARLTRRSPMSESLVVFDELGAGEGQWIAVSEGAEATMPFRPDRVPIDAYCAAILDAIEAPRAAEVAPSE